MKGKFLLFSLLLIFIGCNSDDEIFRLLNISNKNDLILGAYKASKSKNRKFVTLLLKNADDRRMSTNIRFKGFTVYQEKMFALEQIFQKSPPAPISWSTDSVVIKFYLDLASHE